VRHRAGGALFEPLIHEAVRNGGDGRVEMRGFCVLRNSRRWLTPACKPRLAPRSRPARSFIPFAVLFLIPALITLAALFTPLLGPLCRIGRQRPAMFRHCARLVVQVLCRETWHRARGLGRSALADRSSRRWEHPASYACRLVDGSVGRRRVKVGSGSGGEIKWEIGIGERHVRKRPRNGYVR
jgi:hypothetical protein